MLFKIDENLPVEIVLLLAQQGHDAKTIWDQKLVGQPDGKIAGVCQAESRALVTLDLDFADIRTYPPSKYYGIIVLRPQKQDKPRVLCFVQRASILLKTEVLTGMLWIVDESTVRIRGETQQATRMIPHPLNGQ